MEKICPECGGRFVGRIDKIYCCDSCRSNHNNRIYRKRNCGNRRIGRILSLNRKLLGNVLQQGHSSANLNTMQAMGFNPHFWTSQRRRPMLPTRYFCYEYSYTLLPMRIVNIRRIIIAKETDLQ